MKEFVFESLGEGAYVEVTAEDTLSKVRELILEELDSEQLPAEQDFVFKVNGIRISTKQEARKTAFALIDNKAKVELVPKSIKRKISNDETTETSESKRRKLDASKHITPTSPTKQTRKSPENVADALARDCPPSPIPMRSLTDEAEVSKEHDQTSSLEQPENDKNTQSETENDGAASTKSPVRSLIRSLLSGSPRLPWQSNKEMPLGPFGDGDGDDDDSVEEDEDIKASSESAKVAAQPSSSDDDNDFGVDFDNGGVDETNDKTGEDDAFDVGNDEGEDLQVVNPDTDHHKTSDEAKEKSGDVLNKLESILNDNPLFCSDVRRNDWLQEIRELQNSQAPRTVFGVLGNTGVGKSSLLNALLDEAAVLPTSGSRGCTAAVVELVYHSELAAEAEEGAPARKVPVYQGAVEFMTMDDWTKELKILVEECSTQEKTIYAVPPDENRAAAAAAAWQKIEQVYGRDSMKQYHGKATDYVFQRLANDPRVKKHLTPPVPGLQYNVITVQVGESTVGSAEAQNFLKSASEMDRRTRRKRNKLAQEFRKRINSYVYRKGNGSEPQTWPLIRKVQLKGPWSVLNTGAVLVDLPGVRDSNAARAKVAQNYLQNCNQIAIVAPIKRAVDDGTAKELLGEQFKRRLLMDGQYGNVFFICTQTDDLEATETMRDHADVAQQVPGRWEKMEELANSISMLENELHDFKQEEEDLKGKVEELMEQCKEAKGDLKEAREDEADDDTIDALKAVLATHKEALNQAKEAAQNWADENEHKMDKLQDECDTKQKKLKAMCANVRNEYSKACLQEDFRNGLQALYNNDDDDNGDGTGANNKPQNALPDDYNMDVFCISSNDYLKLMGIKSNNDGQANTFSCQRDTQIPQLRSFVHETTARFCDTHAKSFVENTNDLLDRMKLLASDASSVPTGRSAFRMKSLFDAEMNQFQLKVKPIADSFKASLDATVKQSLMPSLQKGARSGQAVAMSTVVSWGSTSRRSKHERRPDKNGLFYPTYQAVLRRGGQYVSGAAGAVDFNQELCDPMEKEFSTEWQAVLDSAIKRLLKTAENSVTQLCDEVTKRLASGFRESGMDSSRLSTLITTAKRSSITALKASFQQTLSMAVDSQRNLSRTLLPAVQNSMAATYANSLNVPRGSGTFVRMKGAMASYSQKAVDGMFVEAMKDLQKGVDELIRDLQRSIASMFEVVQKSMGGVFSICWDDQSGKAELMDPVMMKKIRECRDSLLPRFQELCAIQLNASQLLGIEREEAELDVMAVETLDQSLERRLQEAKKNGNAFDLCDSDAEVPVVPRPRIKADPDRPSASVARAPISSSTQEIIDLCDSDDDWEPPPPSGLSSARKPSHAVKSEML